MFCDIISEPTTKGYRMNRSTTTIRVKLDTKMLLDELMNGDNIPRKIQNRVELLQYIVENHIEQLKVEAAKPRVVPSKSNPSNTMRNGVTVIEHTGYPSGYKGLRLKDYNVK